MKLRINLSILFSIAFDRKIVKKYIHNFAQPVLTNLDFDSCVSPTSIGAALLATFTHAAAFLLFSMVFYESSSVCAASESMTNFPFGDNKMYHIVS